MERDREVERLVRAAKIGFPFNALPEKTRALIKNKDISKKLTVEELKLVEEYLKENKRLPFPDVDGEAFSFYKLYNRFVAPMYSYVKKLMENEELLLEAETRFGIKPKMGVGTQALLWKVLTLEYGKVNALTPLLMLAITLYLLEKGVLGKARRNSEEWKNVFRRYGEYLLDNFGEFLGFVYPLIDEAYKSVISAQPAPPTNMRSKK